MFLIFSYVVTFLKWGLLTFLPGLFEKLVGNVAWTWPVIKQALCHFAGALGVFFIMNLFTCIWNPVTAAFNVPDAIRNIVTTVVTDGVSMVIIFAIDKAIFSPGFGQKKQ